jgi:hypothetical protein
MSAKLRVAGLVACLLALTGVVLLLARPTLVPVRIGLGAARMQPIELVGLAWAVFGCAVWLARGVAVKVVAGLVLAGGIAVQVAALAGPPQNSTDLYRYIWDGRAQVAGVDPYLYPPADAGVARVRNDFLWSATTGPGRYRFCVHDQPDSADPARGVVAGCTRINRPTVPTIYPPVAEAYFTAIQLAAPADDSATPVQAGAAAFAVLTTVILLAGLRRLGRDLRLAALWAWCPMVALEAGQNGHVDVVAVALTAMALLLLAGAVSVRRKVAGGVLLGLAIATKMTPALVLPAVLRRGWRSICAAAAAAVVIVYIPHVIAAGSRIIGYFPGYLNEEGYSSGNSFALIGQFVQGRAETMVAVLILGCVALAVIRYADPARPWSGGVLMTATALAVTTPHYQWYAILLVMLVALDGHPEWLAVAAGAYLPGSGHIYIHGFALRDPRLAGYGGGVAVACSLALLRLILTRVRTSPAAGPAALTTDSVAGAAAETATAEAGWEAAGEPVVEPTAVLVRRPAVTIGTDGMPDFSAGPEVIAASYHVLTERELSVRDSPQWR